MLISRIVSCSLRICEDSNFCDLVESSAIKPLYRYQFVQTSFFIHNFILTSRAKAAIHFTYSPNQGI